MVKVKFFLKSRTSKSNIFLQQLMEKERAIIQFGSITCVSRESSKTVLILQKKNKKKLAYVLDQKIFPGMFFLSLILSFLNLDKLSRCFGFGSQNRSYFIFGKRLGQKKCNKKIKLMMFSGHLSFRTLIY